MTKPPDTRPVENDRRAADFQPLVRQGHATIGVLLGLLLLIIAALTLVLTG